MMYMYYVILHRKMLGLTCLNNFLCIYVCMYVYILELDSSVVKSAKMSNILCPFVQKN